MRSAISEREIGEQRGVLGMCKHGMELGVISIPQVEVSEEKKANHINDK
ncbi:MAG: hypothetical protein ABR582_09240 [Gemmatimonadaceae bacterium]